MIDRSLTLPRLIEQRATDEPDRVFIDRADDGTTLTYGEAHRDALAWAHGLRRLGVERDHTVISMLPVGFDAVSCWVGCMWLVAWEVPVNTSYQGKMLAYTVANSEATVAVIAERFLDRVMALDGEIGLIDTIVVPDASGPLPELGCTVIDGTSFFADGVSPKTTDGAFDGPEPWDVAEIFYTSGTTGPSKGVLYSHAQLHATTTALASEWTADDCFYCPFPMYHVSGKMFVYAFALLGMRGVFRESFKTDEFWPDVRRFGCTTTLLLGAMANFVYRQPPSPHDADTPMKTVLMVPVIPEADDFRRRFDVEINTVFNMTEVSSPIVALSAETVAMPAGSCGRQRDGYECRVVDGHDREVGPGELGELIVRSDEPWVLNSGYFHMPDKTAEAWRNGWFHTGDGFTVDAEGWFYFVDRTKDAIRRRGENISSMEVESHVNDHPQVLESAAIAVPSEWGEDEVMVVVVPKPGEVIEIAALHEHLETTMPRFMVPRFVKLAPELPKTPTEKIRKVALRDEGITDDTWDAKA